MNYLIRCLLLHQKKIITLLQKYSINPPLQKKSQKCILKQKRDIIQGGNVLIVLIVVVVSIYFVEIKKSLLRENFSMVKKFFYEESSRVQKDKKDFGSLSEIKRFGGRRGRNAYCGGGGVVVGGGSNDTTGIQLFK